MNVIQEINRINKLELENGTVNTPASWHEKYANSAWVYVGNLPTQLSEGDIISVMSQYGEIEDINLVREESTGKSKGFAFVKYEDSRSCILAIDNFNGTMILGRSMRVDHVENYRLPKHLQEKEEEIIKASETLGALEAGHAYKGKELVNSYDIHQGQDLFAPVQSEHQHGESMTSNDDRIDTAHKSEAKEARKRERDMKRKEKEARREEREERRRLKRARKLMKEERRLKKMKSNKKRKSRKRHDSDDDSQSQNSSTDNDDGSHNVNEQSN